MPKAAEWFLSIVEPKTVLIWGMTIVGINVKQAENIHSKMHSSEFKILYAYKITEIFWNIQLEYDQHGLL